MGTSVAGRTGAMALYQGMVDHGLIVPAGPPGVFARGNGFEQVLERFNALVSRISHDDRAEVYTFPPVIDRHVIERVRYMETFPQLCGAVCSFVGGEREARELAARVGAGQPWNDLLGETDVVLNPAACYPLYPCLEGVVPAAGRLVTMVNWVFRHEPSPVPSRMQSFRVREFVRVGSAAQAVDWRERWVERSIALMRSLGLRARCEVASDPFFGRVGKVLAAGQEEAGLKLEVVVPITSDDEPTAVCSLNLHDTHFAETFGIRTHDGGHAHTACVGFGLERVVMALLSEHGFDPARWPRAIRECLAL
jgi:seryl-tRNA synthetase